MATRGNGLAVSGIEIAKTNFPGVNFFHADVEKAQEEILSRVGPVDAIISTEVVEHVYNPRAFLRTVGALLKPGGVAVVTTPYHGYLKNLAIAATGKMDQHFTVLWDHGHIKFWSRKTLTQAIEETGMTVIGFRGSGRLPYLWESMALIARKP